MFHEEYLITWLLEMEDLETKAKRSIGGLLGGLAGKITQKMSGEKYRGEIPTRGNNAEDLDGIFVVLVARRSSGTDKGTEIFTFRKGVLP